MTAFFAASRTGEGESMDGVGTLATTVAQGKMDIGIITGTLDALNSGYGSGSKYSASEDMANTYNFSKDVLSAAYNPVGLVVSSFG